MNLPARIILRSNFKVFYAAFLRCLGSLTRSGLNQTTDVLKMIWRWMTCNWARLLLSITLMFIDGGIAGVIQLWWPEARLLGSFLKNLPRASLYFLMSIQKPL